ncbi:UNVERIFIED_CONTAM: hypothetical protein FKN15_042524 [Acipenser sinensis]
MAFHAKGSTDIAQKGHARTVCDKGQCVNRLLEQWDPLTSFIAGEVNSSKPAKATKTASKPAPAKSTLQTEKSPLGLVILQHRQHIKANTYTYNFNNWDRV